MVMTSLLTQRPCFTRRRSRVRVSPRVHFFYFFCHPHAPKAPYRPFWSFVQEKLYKKYCSAPVLPFAGLQTPAKCQGGGVGFKNNKKIGDNIDLCIFAYRIELMTSRMLSRRLRFRCCTDLPTELYPQGCEKDRALQFKVYNRKTRFCVRFFAPVAPPPALGLSPGRVSRQCSSPRNTTRRGTTQQQHRKKKCWLS